MWSFSRTRQQSIQWWPYERHDSVLSSLVGECWSKSPLCRMLTLNTCGKGQQSVHLPWEAELLPWFCLSGAGWDGKRRRGRPGLQLYSEHGREEAEPVVCHPVPNRWEKSKAQRKSAQLPFSFLRLCSVVECGVQSQWSAHVASDLQK